MRINKRLLHDYQKCLNCEHELVAEDHYCRKCGQKRITGRISFRQLVVQFFEDLVNWDARLLKTLRTIFIPGQLTKEYFSGRHVPYWQPIRLFLFMAAVQMLVVNSTMNQVNEKVVSANEVIKKDMYEYFLLQKLDTLSSEVSKQFRYEKSAKAAMDSLLKTYVKPQEQKQNNKSDKKIEYKLDSFRQTIIDELVKNQDSLDSMEIEEDVRDFEEKIIKKSNKNKFHTDMTSQFIEIPFASVKKAMLPKVETDSMGQFKSAGWNINTKTFDDAPKDINGNTKEGKDVLKISKIDFLQLSPDNIIQKYQVDGFWNQVIAKQTIKAMKDGKSGIDFFLSRLSWMIIIMMPVFALFLELVNRPYYYVEHVVFSFHCHAFMFFVISSIFFLNHYIFPESWENVNTFLNAAAGFYLLYYFYKAMRNVYLQNRVKTALKYMFLIVSYWITMLFALVATILTSFFFF
jgi:hypothetical protein